MTKFIQMFSRNLKIAAVIAIACVCTQPAIGQRTPAATQTKESTPQPEKQIVELIYLKHSDAETMVGVLSQSISGSNFRVSVDKKKNAIIVMGTSEQLQTAEELLRKLDSPGPSDTTPSAQQEIKIFQLRYSDATTMAIVLDQTLSEKESGKEGIRITIDKQKNALIMRGTEEKLQIAKVILERLDSPSPSEEHRSLPINVRVFWLIDGDENDAAPAECLKDVVEELHRQGLKNIRQVAQTMVRSQYEGTFQISCSPLLGKWPTMITANGRIFADSKLRINITATKTKGTDKPGETLASVDVNTVFKTNEYIVLAVAPIGTISSVFVIQITNSNP